MTVKGRTGVSYWWIPKTGRLRGFLLAGLLLPALVPTGRGAEARNPRFDLPAGDAAVTLKAFSRQAGREIIYLADQVRAVRTREVTGTLPPREALERMLDGSGLSVLQDEKTGAFAIRQNHRPADSPAPPPASAPPGADRLVLLPPLFVEESLLPAPRWRYARLHGMEFLSACDDNTTEQLIERVYHLNQRLEAFLPEEFRLRLSAPTTFVLYDATLPPVDFKEIIADMQQVPVSRPGGKPGSPEAMTVKYLPNFRLSERDELAVFYVPKENAGGVGDIHLHAGFIRYLLASRTPPLPRWFVEGMMVLYQNSLLEVEPIYPDRDAGAADEELTAVKFPFGSALVRLPAVMFGFETKRLLDRNPDWKAELLPVAEVFGAAPPGDEMPPGVAHEGAARTTGPDTRYLRWSSQAALFIHWALNDDNQSRAALWKFVERACVEPVTEAMFKECFGMDYKAMNRRLADYFPTAVRTGIRLYSDVLPELDPIMLRKATGAEVGRIKGNLERLEIAYVKRKYPALAPKYLAQARRTLQRAYAGGARDPGLLEVMGLCECDAGADAAARPFLEAAVRAGAVRPRAYYELARIRYEDLRREAPGQPFTPNQTAGLLQLLTTARVHSPPLPEVYALMAAIWQQSRAAPQAPDVALLGEGIGLFPENLPLLYSVAALEARRGFASKAQVLIQHGLQITPAGPARDEFLKLQSAHGISD